MFISIAASKVWQISKIVVVQDMVKMTRIQVGGMFEQPFGWLNKCYTNLEPI